MEFPQRKLTPEDIPKTQLENKKKKKKDRKTNASLNSKFSINLKSNEMICKTNLFSRVFNKNYFLIM